MEQRLGNHLDHFYFKRLLPALARLPLRLGYSCVRGLSRLILVRNSLNVVAARQAIQRCQAAGAPLRSSSRQIVRELICQIVWEDFDFFHWPKWSLPTWNSWFEIRGAENLPPKGGAFLLTGHVGSVSVGLMGLGIKGYPVTHVSRDYHREKDIPSAFHEYALAKSAAIEHATGTPLVFADARDRSQASQSVLDISRRLSSGQLVSMALDLPAERLSETLPCRFLGLPVHLGSSIVRLAKTLPHPVIPYWILRDPDRPWRQVIEIEPRLDLSGNPEIAQQICAEALEKIILRHPEQWFTWDSLERLQLEPQN